MLLLWNILRTYYELSPYILRQNLIIHSHFYPSLKTWLPSSSISDISDCKNIRQKFLWITGFVVIISVSVLLFLLSARFRPQSSKLLVFSRLLGLKLLNGCLVVWANKLSVFQHSSLAYCITVATDQSSFYEIHSLAISVNIKVYNQV